jgi:hypothetical protein
MAAENGRELDISETVAETVARPMNAGKKKPCITARH